jgi:hypothetical protein
MRWRKDLSLDQSEIRPIDRAARPEPEDPPAAEEELLDDEHDGWQPVRPRRSTVPPGT